MRLNPQKPGWYSGVLGWTDQLLGRYEKAIAPLQNAISQVPIIRGSALSSPSATVRSGGRRKPGLRPQSSCGSIPITRWRLTGSDFPIRIQRVRPSSCRPAQGGAQVMAEAPAVAPPRLHLPGPEIAKL